jgi:hypothetical protein
VTRTGCQLCPDKDSPRLEASAGKPGVAVLAAPVDPRGGDVQVAHIGACILDSMNSTENPLRMSVSRAIHSCPERAYWAKYSKPVGKVINVDI